MRRFCNYLLVFVSLLPSLTLADVPQPHTQEVFLDRNYNSGRHRHDTLEEEPDVPFYEFRVPIEKIQYTLGDLDDVPMGYRPFVEQDGKTYLRFFVPEFTQVDSIEKLKRDFGDPVRMLTASQIQGKASFHMWDPNAPEDEAVRIKVEREFYGQGRVNHRTQGHYSVLLSQLIKNLEKENLNPLGAFYSEPFSASVKGEDYSFTYLLRRIPLEVTHRQPNEIFVPFHGFLNSPLIKEIAKQYGKSVPRWLKDEYIPKLAKMAAYYNFELGVWFEGHTQNMSMLIDKSTGEVRKFYLKDASDVLIGPFQQAVSGVLPDYKFVPPWRVNETWLQANFLENRHVGSYTRSYLFRSVVGMSSNHIEKRNNMIAFLKSYMEAAGVSPKDLSKTAQSFLKTYKVTWFDRLDGLIFGSAGFADDIYEDLAQSIVQNISDVKMKADFQKALNRFTRRLVPSELKELERIVDLHIKDKKFNFALPNSEEAISYENFYAGRGFLPVKNGVIVYHNESKIPFGVAYHLSEEDAKFVNSLVSEPVKPRRPLEPAKIECEVRLEGAGVP